MKNILFVISAIYLLSFANLSSAAEHSADVLIFGNVASICTLTSDVNTVEVDIKATPVVGTDELANITVICNDADGYVVTLESANSGNLVNDDKISEVLSYEIQYGNETPLSLVTSSDNVKNSPSEEAGDIIRLTYGFTGLSFPVAGTWADTITVSVSSVD